MSHLSQLLPNAVHQLTPKRPGAYGRRSLAVGVSARSPCGINHD